MQSFYAFKLFTLTLTRFFTIQDPDYHGLWTQKLLGFCHNKCLGAELIQFHCLATCHPDYFFPFFYVGAEIRWLKIFI